jgi:hypothetical protein
MKIFINFSKNYLQKSKMIFLHFLTKLKVLSVNLNYFIKIKLDYVSSIILYKILYSSSLISLNLF